MYACEMLDTFFNKVQAVHKFMLPILLFKPGHNCTGSVQHAQEY